MITTLILPLIFFPLGMVLFLRGQDWHTRLAGQARESILSAGCEVNLEYPLLLADGRKDYADLWIRRGDCQLIVEVETTTLHALDNAIKADAAGMRLWVLVPNRRVKKAVQRKLKQAGLRPGRLAIQIFLLNELAQAVTNIFPLISTANPKTENKKQIPSPEKKDAP